jgi:DNA-binding transcriptional LysR family regulator
MDKLGLQTFLAVIERGSLGAAARIMHSTPPTLSRRIRQLEQGLDSRLFDRDHRTLCPTAAGRKLIPHARAILLAMDRACQDVSSNAKRFEKAQLRAQ